MQSSDHDNDGFSNDTDERALEGELSKLAHGVEGGPSNVEGLFRGLQEQLAAERGARAWLRSRSTRMRAAIVASAIFVLVLPALSVFLRPDIEVYPPERMAVALSTIGALLLLTLVLSLRPLQLPALPTWAMPAAVVGSMLGLFGLYSLPAAHAAHVTSLVHRPGIGGQLWRAIPCVVIGLVLGLAIYGLLAVLDRGHERRRLVMAAASGLAANFLLQLDCPVTSPVHMLIGHLGVALLLLAATARSPKVAR